METPSLEDRVKLLEGMVKALVTICAKQGVMLPLMQLQLSDDPEAQRLAIESASGAKELQASLDAQLAQLANLPGTGWGPPRL